MSANTAIMQAIEQAKLKFSVSHAGRSVPMNEPLMLRLKFRIGNQL